jgi:hypothetical protein
MPDYPKARYIYEEMDEGVIDAIYHALKYVATHELSEAEYEKNFAGIPKESIGEALEIFQNSDLLVSYAIADD